MRTRPLRATLVLLLFGALAAALVGCDAGVSPSGAPPDAGTTLAGTSWIVKTVAGRAPVPGAVPTIQFGASTVTGSGGCNHIGGTYQHDAATGQLVVRDLGGTAMGCLQAGVGDFEAAFLQALGAATQARVDGSPQLTLDGPAGRVVLVPLIHP
jgi:heat shock protein HslJ